MVTFMFSLAACLVLTALMLCLQVYRQVHCVGLGVKAVDLSARCHRNCVFAIGLVRC